jgi:hypothetical protein
MADQRRTDSDSELDPECDVAEHASEEVMLLRAAFGGLENALACDAHVEEVFEAWKWAERVETSAWALKNKLNVLRGRK